MKQINKTRVFSFFIILVVAVLVLSVKSARADYQVNFGTISADNGSVSQTITFTNDSGDGSEWTPAVEAPGNSAFTINDDQCSGQAVEDGDSCTVSVDFEPSGLSGTVSTTMDISYTSDQGSGDTYTYDLTANVTPAAGSTTGSSSGTNPTNGGTVDFNPTGTPTPIGQTAEEGTSVTNNSSGTWTNLNVSDLTNSVFSYDPSKSNCDGQNLAAGASCNIYITFDPIASGEQDDTFTVSYTDQNGASQSVSYDVTANAAAGSAASTDNCTAAAIGGINVSVPNFVPVDTNNGDGTDIEYTTSPNNSAATSCQINFVTYIVDSNIGYDTNTQQPGDSGVGFGTNTINLPESLAKTTQLVTLWVQYTDSAGAIISGDANINLDESSSNSDNGTDSNGSTDNGSNDDGGDE